MISKNTIKIQIVKWEKFNPRKKELKSTSWFRLSNSIFENPEFFEFSHSELCVWFYILSQASRKQSDIIEINRAHSKKIGRFSNKNLENAVAKLLKLGSIVVLDDTRIHHESHTDSPLQNITEHNERTEHNTPTRPQAPVIRGSLSKELKSAEEIWEQTLAHFKAKRPVLERERVKLARMIQEHGFKVVEFALVGQRGEKPNENFDPAQHLSLNRIFDPQKIERFINMGSQVQTKQTQPRRDSTNDAPADPMDIPADPKRLREILANAMSGKNLKTEGAA